MRPLAPSLAVERAPGATAAFADIQRNLIPKRDGLESAIIMVQLFAFVARRRAAVRGRMIALHLPELRNSRRPCATWASAGLDWFLNVRPRTVAAAS